MVVDCPDIALVVDNVLNCACSGSEISTYSSAVFYK